MVLRATHIPYRPLAPWPSRAMPRFGARGRRAACEHAHGTQAHSASPPAVMCAPDGGLHESAADAF